MWPSGQKERSPGILGARDATYLPRRRSDVNRSRPGHTSLEDKHLRSTPQGTVEGWKSVLQMVCVTEEYRLMLARFLDLKRSSFAVLNKLIELDVRQTWEDGVDDVGEQKSGPTGGAPQRVPKNFLARLVDFVIN